MYCSSSGRRHASAWKAAIGRMHSLPEALLCNWAGTNFLVRAKAFMEVGGSPTYTLTEDFALGMELKKYGWQCRYVQVRRPCTACLP